MNDSEKIKELEAIIIVLRKMICKLEFKVNKSGGCSNTDKQWLEELKHEATKIKIPSQDF